VSGIMLHDCVDGFDDESLVHSKIRLLDHFEQAFKIIIFGDKLFDLFSSSSVDKIGEGKRSLIFDFFIISLQLLVNVIEECRCVDNGGNLLRSSCRDVTDRPDSVHLDFGVGRFSKLEQSRDEFFMLKNFISVVISGGGDQIAQSL